MNLGSDDWLYHLLRDVSRSFYLTLRVLPKAIRPQIALAYLLARASDTIADTEIVPLEDRLLALTQFRVQVLNGSDRSADLGQLSSHQGSPGERLLLENTDLLASQLRDFSEVDQGRIREVFSTITSGQELDLRRFRAASPQHIVALADDAELDDYTYRVAGCVGEFWTRMCRAHLFPRAALDEGQLLKDGVRFGQGLQLINILRDLATDLRIGRCYMPQRELERIGLEPVELINPQSEPRFRALYDTYLRKAEEHLRAGWRYTLTLPYACWRVRLACAWPILIGTRTLTALRNANILDPNQRVKINRKQVRAILVQSILRYPFPFLWQRLFRQSF